MSKHEELVRLLALSKHHTMDDWERRAQAISFAYGNLALMWEKVNAPACELWQLRKRCAEYYDSMHPIQ